MSLEIKMGHTTYFSAHSFYSLQAGNWHSSPSMSLLLLDPEPSGAGGNLNSADLGSGLLPHPGCTRPPHQLFTQSLDYDYRPPPTGAAGPTPHGCSLLSTSLELFSQGRHVFSHSRCQPRDSRTLAPGHVAHTLSTSDEDTWSQWSWYRRHLLTPSLVQSFSHAELWVLHQDLTFQWQHSWITSK